MATLALEIARLESPLCGHGSRPLILQEGAGTTLHSQPSQAVTGKPRPVESSAKIDPDAGGLNLPLFPRHAEPQGRSEGESWVVWFSIMEVAVIGGPIRVQTEPPGKSAGIVRPLAALLGGATLIAALWSAWAFGGSGTDWRQVMQDVSGFRDQHYALVLLSYFALFALGTVLMLPGVLFWGTLAGGYLFGWPVALAVSLSGGTFGAVTLFLASRSVLRPWFRSRLKIWSGRVEEGVRRDAFSYMLAMRLLFIPYPLVNLLPGLVGVKLRDFVLTTVLGLLPSMAAYAVLGAGIGRSLLAGDAVDPKALSLDLAPALAALGGLALLPVAYRHMALRLGLPDIGMSEALRTGTASSSSARGSQ